MDRGNADPTQPTLSDLAVAVLVPGWSARTRRGPIAVALLAGGVAFPLAIVAYWAFSGRNWVALTLDARFLAWLMAAGTSMVVTRLVAVVEVWRAAGRTTPLASRDAWAVLIVVAVCAPLLAGVVQVGRARASINPVFTSDGDRPLFDAVVLPTTARSETTTPSASPSATTTSTSTTAAPADTAIADGPIRLTLPPPLSTPDSISPDATVARPRPDRPRSGVDRAQLADVTTVLLLGGDAGPDRSGLRTDTMMLFSLHRPSGRAALISVPRDLEGILFPPGTELEARYPYGFERIANSVYPTVSSQRSLREAYDVDGVRPGVVAIAHAIGYSLDVAIDDYVLIDMQGFLELVDVLGGVTVDVPKAVPMPGNVPGAPTQYPDVIGPGSIHMDGTTALGYVRSRKADSDYQRSRRQRDLLEALATQISFDDVVLSFGAVASAIGGTLRTSLTPDELANTLNVIGGVTAIVESVGLVPPLVDVHHPDFPEMARIVGEVQLALVTGVTSGY